MSPMRRPSVEHESFRQDHGVGFDAALSLSSQVSLILKGEASRESYENNSLFTAGSQRNGDRIEGSVGLKIRPSDSLTLLVQGHWADKDARNDGFSYDAKRASAAAYKLFGMGRYLTASVSYTRTEYEQPDGFLHDQYNTRRRPLAVSRGDRCTAGHIVQQP